LRSARTHGWEEGRRRLAGSGLTDDNRTHAVGWAKRDLPREADLLPRRVCLVEPFYIRLGLVQLFMYNHIVHYTNRDFTEFGFKCGVGPSDDQEYSTIVYFLSHTQTIELTFSDKYIR
jgi:hypothetical protein